MENWDVPARDRARESFPAPVAMCRRGSSGQGQPAGYPRSPGVSRGALSGDSHSYPPFIHGSAPNGRNHGDRPGEAPGDPSSHRDPPGSSSDRSGRVTVVVCDPFPVFARGLAKLLEEEAPTLRVTGVEVSLKKAKRSILEISPAVALIGLSAGSTEELDAVRQICSACPATRVVVLLPDAAAIAACATLTGAGIAGIELKERDPSEIADVVTLVARGHIVTPAAAGGRLDDRPDPSSLDDVEREILKGVARSETNRELAARLHVSERTICRRLEGIYSRLHLADRLQAAVYAGIHGFVTQATWHSENPEK
jgi:NarL family two-component system response regulator LiaR